jgi:hypothetical protein
MEWAFVYLMFVLKIPILALLWIVWWAVRSTPEVGAETGGEDGEGGSLVGPRGPREVPRRPRDRGPHGGGAARPPARTRTPAPLRARDRAAR